MLKLIRLHYLIPMTVADQEIPPPQKKNVFTVCNKC